MAAQANIVQEGVDRVRAAFGTLEDEFERVQRRLRARRRDLEKQLRSGRKDLEKRTRKLRSEVLGSSPLKRLDTLRKDAQRQIEDGVGNLLGRLQIASKSDVERIDRKISQLTRKLREIEDARASRSGREALSA
jgi:Skp family chaperone for outer membrane proteins